MAKKVTYAQLHQELFIPGGLGQLGKTLPPQNKTVEMDMTWEGAGLFVKWYTPRGLKGEFIVPSANVALAATAGAADSEEGNG